MTYESLSFGATLNQIDELNRLVRTITASSDAIAVSGDDLMDDHSLPTLGDAIYDAGMAVREIVDQVYRQKLKKGAAAAATAVPVAGRATFASDMHDSLRCARSIVQAADTAAGQSGGAEDAAGVCRAVSELVGRVIDYIERHFDTSPTQAGHDR
ncbi:hypothetical protein [Pseudoxanthomonas wuyuanensis]|uniref:Uncharacterized protein n=1 Tax=Pseudoxanthomonas wuyuanensis TaxID=1073196 RepID=A0A286CWK3_9GAMM|nr:hypothetical protein [Pseudoxanthomonas wuyuanensis]SOD50768.1 hypothetical protein SAMN06296416_101313 [Pseudoxanthomonas wuyuanensis]